MPSIKVLDWETPKNRQSCDCYFGFCIVLLLGIWVEGGGGT